jgi:hypothetical protein
MADYRALAQALDPYAMDTGGIAPDTLKALQTINKSPNLLGMIADIGRGGLSNLESLVRGGVAQVPGTVGDLETLGRMGINTSFGAGGVKVSPKAVMPTTSDILGMMPQRVTQARPETAGMEELGTMIAPGLAKAVAPVGKGYLSLLGNEINAGMTGQPTRSVIGQITPKPLQLDVYHGTPHTLPPTERNLLGEFDASKIGTGEGAQAYGHGIYVAENPSIGRYYQNALGKYIDRIKIGDTELPVSEAIAKYADNGEGSAKALQRMKDKGRLTIDQYNDMIRDEIIPEIRTNLNLPKEKWETVEGLSGNLYKADLPDEMIPKMLNWDKPLTEQKSVMSAIRSEAEQRVRDRMLGDIENNIRSSLPKPNNVENNYLSLFSNENVAQNQEIKNQAIAKLNEMDINSLVDKELQSMKPADMTWDMTGKQFYELLSKQSGSAKQASEIFRNQGIPGIKYLDEGSRRPGVTSMTQAQLDARISTLKKDIDSGLGNQDRMKQILSSLEQERASHPKLTHNFVVFPGEEQNIKILERNAEKTTK